ncbi:Putative proteasome inhibitor [Habropoda laboriosa]|uniref:Proteasome inhibitor PI31 subunit n=1 Tax=Habropoda laboriosa TaxID=597456 RepID=A0A0L7R3Q6_9HYME|nr:PREDICTED: proteasome inhibitor PI31 subunit [Habropoda laboriosa]KOC65517.1 Putative proteasome inhibitor [Habropoda laboriosa]
MGDENSDFGFALLQELHKNQIVKKEDVLILFVHWYFTKLGFRCLGIGRFEEFEPSEKGSQLLPEGWSAKQIYELRYIKDKDLYILLGLRTNDDEDLLINLWKNQQTSSIQVPINQTVTSLHAPLESLIPSYQNIIQTIQKDLINPHLPDNATGTTEQSTQTTGHFSRDTSDSTSSVDSLLWGQRRHRPPARGSVGVGRADLDPFSPGGGMIFDPFDPLRHPVNPRRGLVPGGILPPGAIPPSARFDPLGPPDIDHPRHLRDPDNNDMFM